MELVGDVLRGLGVEAGAVVHGGDGIDEIGGDRPTAVYSFGPGGARRWQLDPRDYGIHAPLEAIRGESVERCRQAFAQILGGESSPRADVVALNAAFALQVCGAAETIGEGLSIAREMLTGRRALQLFERAKGASRG
jgi:anthranilate phosphoribosyltransferase